MDRDSIGAFGIGLAAGTLIGLAVGILYAPHKGSVTREIIRERAEEVKGKAEEFVDKAEDLVGKAREKAEDLAGKAREKVGELKRREA